MTRAEKAMIIKKASFDIVFSKTTAILRHEILFDEKIGTSFLSW
jgi:hypothetical protein